MRINNISIYPNETIIQGFSEDGSQGNQELLTEGTYTFITVFLFTVFVFGTIVNGAVMYVYFSSSAIKNNASTFIFALCVCGFIISTLGVPFAASSSLKRKWLFGDVGCSLHAALFTGLGITMIAILTFIAVDRYVFVVKFSTNHKLTHRTVICMVVVCFIYGCSWGMFPMFGWGSYDLEIARISCSVSWEDRSASSISFCVLLMVAGLILPISIILYMYAQIMNLLHKRRKTSMRLSQRSSSQRRKALRREHRVAGTIFLMIGAFVVTWLPYSVFATVAIFGYRNNVPPVFQTLPSIFAKASVLWNPIIYTLRTRALRKALTETFPFLHFIKWQRTRLHRTPVTQLSLTTRPRQGESSATNFVEYSKGELVSSEMPDLISQGSTAV